MQIEEMGVVFKEDAIAYHEDLLALLMETIDPELGIDLVNLGLIYEVEMNAEGHVTVLMTLTTMGCPLIDVIEMGVRSNLGKLPYVEEVDVVFTFDPPWGIERMSKFARIALGVPLEVS